MAYTNMSSEFTYRKLLAWQDLDALAENDAQLKLDGWADNTKAIFYQAAAPTGWTKDVVFNDRILRVVSGVGGGNSAGTQGISSAITLAHTHVISSEANHANGSAHEHTLAGTFSSPAGSSGGNLFHNDGTDVRRQTTGSDFVDTLTNSTASTSPSVTSAGTHDHGGTTGSQLANITLAYVDALVCTKDTSSGYTDKTSAFTFGDDLGDEGTFQDLDDMTANDAFLQARLTPAGSVSLFYNSTAPTGWTKLTTQDDKAVRVVSGAGGGAGGTVAMSTTISLAHNAHSMTAQGTHSHDIGAHTHVQATSGQHQTDTTATGNIIYSLGGLMQVGVPGSSTAKDWWNGSATSTTPGATSTDPDHSHALASMLTDTTLARIDVIQCSKDATGAEPFPYQDLTTFFADQNLLAYQDLNDMGKNDEHLRYRTTPAASAMLFFQAAAPLAWTKVTSQDDKAVRIVSGSGGVAGGTLPIAAGITLAHTHAITAYDHSHTFGHVHSIASTTNAIANNANRGVSQSVGQLQDVTLSGGGIVRMNDSYDSAGTTAIDSHAHGGATSSALSNVTLAYLDVLLCTKD